VVVVVEVEGDVVVMVVEVEVVHGYLHYEVYTGNQPNVAAVEEVVAYGDPEHKQNGYHPPCGMY